MPFLYPYIGSYFHYIDESITVKNTSIFATIFTIMEAILMCASIVIYSRIGFRKTFYLIIAAQFTFNIVASWCTNFYLFCLAFSFSNAFASGGFMYVSMYCVWQYFPPEKKGLMSGIVASSYAIFPVITANIAFYLVNPENIQTEGDLFPQHVASRVPTFVRTLGFFYLVCGVAGCALIMDPLEQEIRSSIQKMDVEPVLDHIDARAIGREGST